MWREFRYRRIMNASHEEFMVESRDRIEGFIAFESLLNEVTSGE